MAPVTPMPRVNHGQGTSTGTAAASVQTDLPDTWSDNQTGSSRRIPAGENIQAKFELGRKSVNDVDQFVRNDYHFLDRATAQPGLHFVVSKS